MNAGSSRLPRTPGKNGRGKSSAAGRNHGKISLKKPGGKNQGSVTENAILHTLGNTVRSERLALGLSQRTLAKRSGLSPRFIAQLEAGQGNISVVRLAGVAKALEIPLPSMLAGVESPALPGDGEDSAPEGAHASAPPEMRGLQWEIAALLEGRPAAELRAVRALLNNGPDSRPQRPIVSLVGLRGAGKSTLGPLLGEALGCPFLEMDDEIGELTGLATSEIFELHGERYYRTAELRTLERVIARGAPAVVAVSGGAVTDPDIFRLLKERTLLVWLRATAEQHMERVVSQGDRRPMANRPNARAELRGLLAARTPYYRQARLIADTGNASPEACLKRLLAGMERL